MRSDTKILAFSLMIIFIIIFTGFSIKLYLNKTTNRLLKELEVVENYVNSDKWDEAHQEILKLNTKWEKAENTWTLFTNHHEIDSISISLKNTNEYIRTRERGLTMASIASLKHYISHIPDMEKISLKNIF